MRSDGPGAKPKCGYIAITFSATATYGVINEKSGERAVDGSGPAASFRLESLTICNPGADGFRGGPGAGSRPL